MKLRSVFPGSGRGPSWALLTGLTLGLLAVLEAVRLPAAALLAGMACAAWLSLRNTDIHVPRSVFHFCQSILGLMISRSFTLDLLEGVARNGVLMLVVVSAVILLGLAAGMTIAVKQWLPGTTGIWGISPGGASAMIVLSQGYGGDMRLVAIMQYLRVTIIAVLAAAVARVLGAATLTAGPSLMERLFPATDGLSLVLTLAAAVVCWQIARLVGGPSSCFLVPMAVGAVLHNAGILNITLPGWLLALDFMLIGWHIGLGFNREILLYAFKAMPKILGAIAFMVGSAGLLAWVLVACWDIDPLTAYLATSPGGADAIAIIAASSGGDVAFIMAAQTLRMLMVILLGPYLARLAAHLIRKRLGRPVA